MPNPFFNILSDNFQRLQHYLGVNKIEAFRLYNQESPALPLAIDLYRNNAVIHVFAPVSGEDLADVEAAMRGLPRSRFAPVSDFFYKNRTKNPDYSLPKCPQKQISVVEYGHRFAINLSDYLDTGLFLDHRETRKWIQEQSKGKVVLNTFAYTGSFSIYAAAGGAAKTYSVDLSRTYCDWIKQNLTLNQLQLEQNWVYKMDTLEFFRYAKRKNLFFDIIIIDPPTFSRNKSERFSVQTDHPALINGALEILNPGGFMLFSNNFQEFRLQKNQILPCKIQSKTDTIPPDFASSHPHHCFIISKSG